MLCNCEVWFYDCDRTAISIANRLFREHGLNVDEIFVERVLFYVSSITRDLWL